MVVRYFRLVLGPAVFWAAFLISAFVGIGGMSIMGGGASDADIARMWKLAGLLAAIVFVIVLTIRIRQAHRQIP